MLPFHCICTVCMYGHTYSKCMDQLNQPGKVSNPARGQLNRKKKSLSAFAPENLVSRDEFGSPVTVFPHEAIYAHLSILFHKQPLLVCGM